MRFVVDRIESDYAVIETDDKRIFNVPKAFLPDAKEGKCYIITEDENYDSQKMKNLVNKLFV